MGVTDRAGSLPFRGSTRGSHRAGRRREHRALTHRVLSRGRYTEPWRERLVGQAVFGRPWKQRRGHRWDTSLSRARCEPGCASSIDRRSPTPPVREDSLELFKQSISTVFGTARRCVIPRFHRRYDLRNASSECAPRFLRAPGIQQRRTAHRAPTLGSPAREPLFTVSSSRVPAEPGRIWGLPNPSARGRNGWPEFVAVFAAFHTGTQRSLEPAHLRRPRATGVPLKS